jgi:IS5 family transposase
MYRKQPAGQLAFEDFYLPFGGKLRSDNRWVILAKQIPWQKIDDEYSVHFNDLGCPAKPARVALGSLLIKERLGTTDRETVQQIAENPYLQYFLGFHEYKDEVPFDHTLMTTFRKRFTQEMLADINEALVRKGTATEDESQTDSSDENDDDTPTPSNNGKLIIDATCTPADVAYPTDLNLLNDAREKTDEMIDAMHKPSVGKRRRPRTYRQKARKEYLAVAKQKKPGRKKIRRAIGKQLNYLRRNLKQIEKMIAEGLLRRLDKRLYRLLLVVNEVYRQQRWMYESQTHKISGRIVSLSQPHVRPIVRGKAKSPVEFGAKISVALVDGFGFVDRINWEAYNESGDLKTQVEEYRNRFGVYPESVHADKIYRTRENRQYCKANGIRLSGRPLGRPKRPTTENAEEWKREKKQMVQDEIDRIAIEGKFGQGKRRFSLDRIMAKLAGTSETVIMVAFLVMNLEKILAASISFLLSMLRVWLRGVCYRFPSARPHLAAA